MKKILLTAILFATPLFAGDTTTTATGEYGNHCALGLGKNMEVKTDCAINWTDSASHKKYCFSSEDAKKEFAKDTAGNVKLADAHYKAVVAKAAVGEAAAAVKDAAGKTVDAAGVQTGKAVDAVKETAKEVSEKVAEKM